MLGAKLKLGYIDITLPISDRLPTWPGDPGVSVMPVDVVAEGDAANVASLSFSSHTGTHIDAPRHIFDDGKTVDQIPIELLIGPCRVIEPDVDGRPIEPSDLKQFLPLNTERLLIKTGNSELWEDSAFFPDYSSLSPSAAELLVASGVLLVGVDYLSIDEFSDPGLSAHRVLLAEDVVIVEGLDLRNAKSGEYLLTVLPLRIQGGDGAPARAILEPLQP